MDMNKVATQVAKEEGLKKAVNIAQIKEIIRLVARLVTSEVDTQISFLEYGIRQNKKLEKSKKDIVK